MEKKFVKGLYCDSKSTQYGEIIKLSFKVSDFITFLNENMNDKGYVNVDVLSKKEGGKYAVLNDYKGQPKEKPATNFDELNKQADTF